MATDEEFIEQLRSSLRCAVANANPPADMLIRVAGDLEKDGSVARAGFRSRPINQSLRASFGALPTVLGIGITVVVAITAVMLLTRPSTHPTGRTSAPAPPGSPSDLATRYAARAMNKANHSQACASDRSTAPHRSPPTTGTAIPKELTSLLGVLRRPSRSGDYLAALLHRPAVSEARVIYPTGMRLALTQSSRRYYLLPITSTLGFRVSDKCAAARRAALRHERPNIPPALRDPAERALAALTARQRYDATPHPAICELELERFGGSSGCTASARQIEQSGTLEEFGNATASVATGIVPDGVASVTLRFTSGQGHAQSITTQVTNNVFGVARPNPQPLTPGHPPVTAFGRRGITTIVWRDQAGHIIKTVSGAQAEAI